ncbi:DNA-directed RNA polymerase subunit [Aphelenchoides besseyi]|nr:DNA-directed RNA polymerase subunit [Aphelenchoides besseyi]
MGKEIFRESDKSTALAGVRFTAGSATDIRQSAHIEIFNNRLYDVNSGRYAPALFGPLDTRLGICQKTLTCETCGQKTEECVGHFGYLNLEYPVYHVGFFRLIIQVLQCICKKCACTLLVSDEKQKFVRQILTLNLDYLRRKAIHKKLVAASKKISICPHCGFVNGVVKKAVGAVLKIVHAEEIEDESNFTAGTKETKELSSMLKNVKFNLLDPLRVYNLFRRVDQADIPFLMVQSDDAKHPADLLLTRIAVPPVCIRPSVISDTRSGTNEDDLTIKLTEIMLINDVLKKHKHDGAPMKIVSETWDHLQIQCALYINSEINGLPPDLQPKKFVRSFTQRLKGKQGRFRGNLSGKRVDFSGRTVISPDPNLKVDQVGVPIYMAKTLTFPEFVNATNIEEMRKLVRNGESKHPGANHIIDKKSGNKRSLKYCNLEVAARQLRYGDIVERHLRDDDIVLFNRQPSLHRISIMAHRAKVMPYRTLRFNECACTPYNADFDGDEMNIHLPQTYEARAEASMLMSIRSNLITPRSGEPLVAAIQDFITAAYLLTHKDTFLPRDEVYRCCAAIIDVNSKTQHRIRVPPPAIVAPIPLWTGKQLAQLIIAPERNTHVRVNISTPNKSHPKGVDEFSIGDTYVIIRNNQLLAGMLDKALLGSGSKTNIFYILMRDFGEEYALEAMWRLARMSPVYLSNRGFSIGIGDVTPSAGLIRDKKMLLHNGYTKCEEFIEQLRIGKLKARPGQTEAESLESLIMHELSQIRDHAGKACVHNLSRRNTPLTMAICGSKGSYINISQMIACVGQQSISGHRPSEGFEFRCLPMFERNDKTPVARGFVENSFYSGLTPTEFFYHTMAGREGLVDTAVKTAETGYMQRRLVKCLEDLAVSYDSTVRTSVGEIVQFRFGEDGLDPCCMEAKNGNVVDFDHILYHTRNTSPFELDKAATMSVDEMRRFVQETVEKRLKSMHGLLTEQVIKYLLNYQQKNRKYVDRPQVCEKHARTESTAKANCSACSDIDRIRKALIRAHYLSCSQLVAFANLCAEKLRRSIVEPGTAVGAISATSIGEPSTQMTLKTFHFAGVASMNITEGVPRIKEIINAVRNISTPVITVELINNRDEKLARRVKSRIEKTTLGEISEYIEQVYLPDDNFVLIKLSAKRIRLLQLEVTMDTITQIIATAKLPIPLKGRQVKAVGKTMIVVHAPEDDNVPVSLALHYLKYSLPSIVIKGMPHITRCVIHADEKKGDTYQLLVEGTDYREVLATYEIEPTKTTFNNANVIAEVLGIEAARTAIISEIISTMNSHGIELDRRHVMLLADLMTYKLAIGEVLGITRNGLVKMKESVLLLASFERTTDHLFEAAFFGQKDEIIGVSESIIMGTQAGIGTGMMKLLQNRGPTPSIETLKRTPIFDSPELKLKI